MDWREKVGVAATVFLGAILLLAVVGKAADPLIFVQQIRNEELTGLLSANSIALIALALEAGLGTALLLGVRSMLILGPTAALVAFFLFLTGRNLVWVLQGIRDPSYDCGCFGFLWERTASEAFWQDLLLLVPPLIIAFWSRRAASPDLFPPRRLAASGLAVLLTLSYVIFVPGLPPQPQAFAEAAAESSGEYVPSPEMELWRDGKEEGQARVFQSPEGLTFLIEGTPPGPLLLDPRTGKVSVLGKESLRHHPDGSIDLVAAAEAGKKVSFEFSDAGPAFTLSGSHYELRSRQ